MKEEAKKATQLKRKELGLRYEDEKGIQHQPLRSEPKKRVKESRAK